MLMMQRGISPTRKVIELRKAEKMTKPNILKNGVRSTRYCVLVAQWRLIESPNFFGGGYFMLKKSAFPAEYELFKKAVDNKDWAIHQAMTDKDVKKAFAYKSGKLKLFEPLTYDDHPSLQDGDNNRFNSKYYWYLCKVLGCTLHFGDYLTPVTIKKDNRTVGYAMGMSTLELGHIKGAKTA